MIETEIDKIKQRYLNRENLPDALYSPLAPYSVMIKQEKQRAIVNWINKCGIAPVENKSVLEIGCGNGNNLLQLIDLGFNPSKITGNDLLPDRISRAKQLLPASINLIPGNALTIDLPLHTFDIVYQSMVFSSILDYNFKIELAKKMWDWIKPGGGILWYDFIYNNPKNKDVRGIPYNEVKQLFKFGHFKKWKITLAPPLSRIVTKLHPSLYTFFNSFVFLRTHILCWISKE